MRIKIDMNGNSPAYIQMSAQIAAAIRAGEYRTGDKLPSEAEFCHETGLAKGTVRKTFDKLEEEGYIRRVHGSTQTSPALPSWVNSVINPSSTGRRRTSCIHSKTVPSKA